MTGMVGRKSQVQRGLGQNYSEESRKSLSVDGTIVGWQVYVERALFSGSTKS